jgi:hypothetical protein
MRIDNPAQAYKYLIQINVVNVRNDFPRLNTFHFIHLPELNSETLFTYPPYKSKFKKRLLKLQWDLNPNSVLNDRAVKAYLKAIDILLNKLK